MARWKPGPDARSLLELTRPESPADLDYRNFEWYFLNRLDRTPIWSSGTKDTLSPSIALGADGTWFAMARDERDGRKSDVVEIDARTGKVTRTIVESRARFSRISISPDGKLLESMSENGAVVLHDTHDGHEVQRLPAGTLIAFSNDGRFLAWLDRKSKTVGDRTEVVIWELAGRREVNRIAIPSSTNGYMMAFSPDGKRLATTGGAALQVWDPSTGKIAWKVESYELFTDMAFSPDGRFLAGSSFRGWIGLWDAATGVRGATLASHRGEINRIRFSPDGKRLASAGRDRVVRIWDVSDGRVQLELRGHESDVWDLAFTPDGTRLASVSFLDGVAKLWDTKRGQESIELMNGSPSPISLPTFGLAFNADGRVLIAAQAAGALQAWDMDRKTSLFKLDNKVNNGRNWVAVSPKSDVLATLDEKRSIVLRNPSSGVLIRTLDSSEGSRVGAFSPDGQFLAAGGGSPPTIRVWEVASGHLAAILHGHTEPVECLAFSPDGQKLASGSFDATVRIWDFPSRKELLVYRGHSKGIATVAFSPDGKKLASAGMDNRLAGEIQLWDVATGQDPQATPGTLGLCPRPFVPP